MPTIKELRLKLGWTQADLARESGVSATTISKIERGGSINKATLKLVLQALRVQTGEVQGVVVKNRVLGRSEQ